jgi:hypothetical protein
MTYTVSFSAQTIEAVIQRRPWWNLFGKDSLLRVTRRKRYVVTTDKKPDFETLKLIASIFNSPRYLQVEECHPASSYIATTGSNSTEKDSDDGSALPTPEATND